MVSGRPHLSGLSTLLRTPLTALLAVAETGSFSKAAAELGLSQSTLSAAVRQAEDALGVVMFARGRHGATLTPAGEAVMVHVRHAALAVEAMELTARGQLTGTLRIAACRSVLKHVVMPALRTFAEHHPRVTVTLVDTRGEHDEVAHLVDRGEVHLGLGRLPMPDRLLTAALVADEYLIVTAAHASPIRTWDALHAAQLIVCEEDCAPYVAAHVAQHSRAPHAAVRLHDPGVALGLVADGHGVTILSRLVLTPLPQGLRTESLPVPLWRSIGIVTSDAGRQHPLAAAFIDLVLTPTTVRARLGSLARVLRFPPELEAVQLLAGAQS
ncbi:LysR family transcriptional regulator (plasmid) [Deinococcus sp. KNUC1210]|uniref:LysR family transcriptional regulator n=1 Tax=Deinococcus sp. KNUC1210 TaxID=2917691 RepID=UPI001EEFC57E|nr:LysR family transcriptional regulator [Deinococcus sp. KNUC1210]ULH13995.1 LysR family transcriptional regulator [Deinococcus sp. KNUC1210]